MALFGSDASEFLDKLKHIDKFGIVELTQAVEDLTKAAENYEKVFDQATNNGVTLTKRQSQAWKSLEADIKSIGDAIKTVNELKGKAWQEEYKVAPKGSNEQKEIVAKISAYEKLLSALKAYQQQATSAYKSGDFVHNQRSTNKYIQAINVGNEQPKGEVLPKEQIEAQAESLVNTANNAFNQIKGIFTQPVSAIGIVDAIKQAEEELLKLQSQAKKHKVFNPNTKQYDLDPEYAKNLEEAENKLQSLKDIRDNWGSIKDDRDKLKEEEEQAKKAEEQYERLKESKSEQNPESMRLGQAISEADTSWITQEKMSAEELRNTYKELLEEKKSIESQKPISAMSDSEIKDYAQIIASMNKIAEMQYGAKGDNGQKQSANVQEKEQEFNSLAELKQAIEETKGELDSLREKAKNGELVDFEKSVEEAKILEAELKRLESMRNALEGKPQKPTKENQDESVEQEEQKQMNLLDLLKETISVKAQLAKEKTALPFSSDMEGAQSNIQALGSRMKELNSIWSSMKGSVVVQALSAIANFAKNAGSAIANGLVSGFKLAINGAKQLASTILSLAKGAFDALKSAISTTLGNMQRLVSGGFNAVKNGVSAVAKGFNTVRSTMQSLVKKGTPNLMKSLTSLKSMLMRRIKRTFISSIFNQAKEGLQQLAKSSEEFNKTMSNLKNSAKQVSGNLAITLGNLLQTVEPVLQTLLGWLNSVFEAVNGLFALLSGKKTMLVAKQGTDDYAKSLGKASSSAKDLNHQLYGFDELTRQEDNSGNNSGAGKIQYEEQAIGDALGGINDFFEKMLSAFQQGQFEKVGELAAEQLNNLIYSVDGFIERLAPKATEWAGNIARILNGLVEQTDFYALGDLIGDGLNLAFEVANEFFTKFNFDTLGKKCADGIMGIFDSIEWDLAGETIANGLNSVWDFFGNLFDGLNWQSIGYKLALGVSSLFENIEWDKFEKMWVEGINGVTLALWTFIDGVDWGDIATQFFNSLNNIVNGIKWDNISGLISTGIKSVLSVFEALIDSNFFVNLASKLGATVGGILNDIDWGRLAGDIILGLAQLRTAFWTLINNLNLPNLAIKLAEGINSLLTNEKVNVAWEESSQKAIEGLGKIVDAFSNFVERIKLEEIMGELGEKVSNLFKNIEWSKLATSVRLGLDKVINGFTNFIKRANFPDIAKDIGSALSSIFSSDEEGNSIFTSAAELVKTGLGELTKAFGNLVSEIFKPDDNGNTIGKNIGEAFNKLFEKSDAEDSLFYSIGNTIGTAFSNVVNSIMDFIDTGALGNMASGLLDMLTGALNSLFYSDEAILNPENADKIGKSISKGITDIFQSINDWFDENDFAKIGEGIGEALANVEWDKIAGQILELLWNAVNAAINLAGGFMGSVLRKIFGVELTDEFNAEGSVWAQSAYDGFRQSLLDGSAEGNAAVLEAAAMWAAGFGEGLSAEFEEGEVQASQALTDLIHQLVTTSGDNQDLIVQAAGRIGSGFPYELVQSLAENGTLVGKSADELLRSLYNAQTADEVRKLLGDTGNQISQEFIDRILAMHEPAIRAGKNLLYAVQNAESAADVVKTFGDYGISISESFADSIMNAGTENTALAIEMMAKGIDEKAISVMDVAHLSEHLKEYMEATGGDLNTLCQTLMSGSIEDIKAIATTLGVDVGKNLGSVVPEAMEASLQSGEQAISDEKDKLAKSATLTDEQKNAMRKSAKEGGEGVTGGLTTAQSDGKKEVVEKTGEVTSAVSEKYEALPDEVKPYAENLITYVCEALADKDGTVKAAIEAVAQSAVDRAKEILNGETGIEIATTFLNGVRDGINDDTSRSDSIENMIANKSAEVVVNASNRLSKDNGEAISKGFIGGIHDGLDDKDVAQKIQDTVVSPFDSAVTFLNSIDSNGIGSNFVGGIYDGLGTKDVKGEVNSITSESVDYANSNMSYDNGYKIGQNMIVGLYNGFASYGQDLVDFIAHVCSVCADTARDILGISSPSKVFAQIGAYTMEGMQIGLEDTGKDAISTVSDVAKAITEAGDEASIGNVMGDGLDGVASELERIVDIFSDMADVIASMGGLEIPTIASGRTIPYATQIEQSRFGGASSMDTDAIEEAFYSALNRISGTSNGEQEVNITLQVDGRKLTDIVTKYQRQQSRAWGV